MVDTIVRRSSTTQGTPAWVAAMAAGEPAGPRADDEEAPCGLAHTSMIWSRRVPTLT